MAQSWSKKPGAIAVVSDRIAVFDLLMWQWLAKAGERPWEMPNVRSVWMPAKKCSEKVALEKRPFVRSHLGATDKRKYEMLAKQLSQNQFRNCLDFVSWCPNPSKGGLKLTMCTTLPIHHLADLIWSSVVFHASSYTWIGKKTKEQLWCSAKWK